MVFVDITDEFFPVVGQLAEKSRVIAIKAVKTDPFETDPIPSCLKDHLQRLLMLGFEDGLINWDLRLLAAFLILDPLLGKKQPEVNRDGEVSPSECGNNRHLAIVDFAELAAPLPGDTNRFLPLLRDSGFVDD